MSKRFIAGLTLFSFTALAVPVAALPGDQAAARVAVVTVQSSSGEVTLQDSGAAIDVGSETGVGLGETVRVGADGELTLLFPNGARARVASSSEFRLLPSSGGTPELYLVTGRVLTSTTSEFTVKTYSSNAVASTGEFLVETNPQGTGLRILSGNARLQSKDPINYSSTGNDLPGSLALTFENLATEQTTGDFQFGAQKGKKGKSIREAENEEATGGVGEVAPDQDMINPGRNEVAQPVPPETPPVTTTTPPPTTTTTPPPVAGGGSIWPYLLGAAGLAGLLIALTNGNDENIVVPSPSLP